MLFFPNGKTETSKAMDKEKAGEVSSLYQKAAAIRRRIKEYRVSVDSAGATTIVVDCSWLPEIIKIAEAELAEVEAKLAEM